MLLPGGLCNDAVGDIPLLYLLERKSDSFSFSIINTCATGGLVEYHPVSANSPTDMKYKMTLVIDNVPHEKITDSSFWFFLYRLQVNVQYYIILIFLDLGIS
jgi:hypothetical protein